MRYRLRPLHPTTSPSEPTCMSPDELRPRPLPLIVALGVISAFDAMAIDL
jgi:hypothetical protein